MLRKRLEILFFYNNDDVETSFTIFDEKLREIGKVLEKIKKLRNSLKVFYEVSQRENIKMLDDFEKQIKNGNINELDKEENKEKLNLMENILTRHCYDSVI